MVGQGERRQITIQQPHILLVEGLDDITFFEYLAIQLKIEKVIQIISFEGKSNLRAALRQIRLAPLESSVEKILTLGIARDSDDDNAFQSVCHALQDIGFSVPQIPLSLQEGEPKTIVMLFPDEATPGTLEDLCLRAFVKDPALTCADEYLQCLIEQKILLRSNIITKAKLQVFFASKEEETLFLRRAVQRNWWPWDDSTFDQAKAFLQQIASG
jgi:hypothetical protein